MLPADKIEPGAYDFKFNTLLSELTLHVLLRRSLNCLLFMHHFTFWILMIYLESIEHKYVRI